VLGCCSARWSAVHTDMPRWKRHRARTYCGALCAGGGTGGAHHRVARTVPTLRAVLQVRHGVGPHFVGRCLPADGWSPACDETELCAAGGHLEIGWRSEDELHTCYVALRCSQSSAEVSSTEGVWRALPVGVRCPLASRTRIRIAGGGCVEFAVRAAAAVLEGPMRSVTTLPVLSLARRSRSFHLRAVSLLLVTAAAPQM
jgi:hypothetical protein